MKPFFCIAALSVMLSLQAQPASAVALSPTPTVQAEEPQQSSALRTSKQANLRKYPDQDSMRLETLQKHAAVTILDVFEGDGEDWLYVRVRKSGREGYILNSLLEPIPTPSPTPTQTPTPSPSPIPTPTLTPSPTPDPNAPKTVKDETLYDEPEIVRTMTRANLRKTPGGNRLEEIKPNTQLTVIGEVQKDDELWLHVQKGSTSHEGYMLAELVRQVRPVLLVEMTEGEIREKFPVVSRDPIADIQTEIPFTYTDEELSAYTTLRIGDSSKAVLALRRRLYELGYYAKPNENTRYTQSTADVISHFQRDCGLEATGDADPYTQALLFDDRMLARKGSAQEIKYLSNKLQPLYIQKAEVTMYSFYGSVQVSVRNNTGHKLTAFALKIIPNTSDGTPADLKPTFAEEIEREYTLKDIAIAKGDSYSDFITNGLVSLPGEDYYEPEIGEVAIYPHHFQVSYKNYFSGAQVAVSRYRSGGKNVYVDDDQMVFIGVGKGTQDILMHTLPIEISDSERAEAQLWEMGIVSRYVLPLYQEHYQLPQGAYLRTVKEASPAQEAGLETGDIIVGIGDITILGDATLRKARASIKPGESVPLYFWRDGVYYSTELVRPSEARGT